MNPTLTAAIAPARLPAGTAERTRVLIEAVSNGRGGPCASCSRSVSAHEVLLSIGTGYRNAARCLDCLARDTGNAPAMLLNHLAGFFRNRCCYAEAWRHATALEGREPTRLDSSPFATPDLPTSTLALVADDAWDAGDMGCGELVMELRLRLRALEPGEILELRALDPGGREDIPAWCRLTGHSLLRAEHPLYFIQRKEN